MVSMSLLDSIISINNFNFSDTSCYDYQRAPKVRVKMVELGILRSAANPKMSLTGGMKTHYIHQRRRKVYYNPLKRTQMPRY